MFRFIGIASLAAVFLVACSEDGKEASFMSEAVAAPAAKAPDYGWRTDMAPDAVQEGTVKDYN
jgi:hypothetical protein